MAETSSVLDLTFHTALGTITLDPIEVAGKIVQAAQSLEEARSAAGLCEEICKHMRRTIINRLPIICKLLNLGQLFPEDPEVIDLNTALMQCIYSVCDVLHESMMAMYKYLQCGWLSQMQQAKSMESLLSEKRLQLRSAFDDVNAYMHLATLLPRRETEQQAQQTQIAVRELTEQVQALERFHVADKEEVKHLAAIALEQEKVAALRCSPEGQEMTVSQVGIWAVAISPTGERFVTGSEDGTSTVWDATTGRLIGVLSGHSNWVTSVAWSPDGCRVATGSCDKTAALWDAVSCTCIRELTGHSDWVLSVAWSPDGAKVATGSDDRTAVVWDAVTGTCIHELTGHNNWVTSVAWSPDGCSVATGSADKSAGVWNADTGTRLHQLRGHSGGVKSVAWSPDGCRLVTGSADKTAVVWDVGTGTRMHQLRGHSHSITSVSWSPDGLKVVTGSHDKTSAVWTAATGTRMHVLSGHRGSVRSVRFTPDGREVYTASEDGSVRIYNIVHAGRE